MRIDSLLEAFEKAVIRSGKYPGTHPSSWTQKCYKGFLGFNPFQKVVWTFPQVLLIGVNPLVALNKLNSAVFVIHLLSLYFPLVA